MSEGNPSKQDARVLITSYTEGIVRLVNRRAAAALEAGAAKVAEGATQIRDLERERQVIAAAIEVNDGPLANDAIGRIIQTVMNEASLLQSVKYDLPLGVPIEEGPGFDLGALESRQG